jgi:phage N-6-adenine-methyltransferase
MKGQAPLFSSASDEYETPEDLFDLLNVIFRFTVDPCASLQSHMLSRYWTMAEDGLAQDWNGETLYINPPYSNGGAWIQKASQTFLDGHSQSVILVPARTDTSYWQNHVFPVATALMFLRGRLAFISRSKIDYLAIQRFVIRAKNAGWPHYLHPLLMEGWRDLCLIRPGKKKSTKQIERLGRLTTAEQVSAWTEENGPLAERGREDTQSTVDKLYRHLGLIGTAPFPSALIFYWSSHQDIRRFGDLWADKGSLVWLQHPGQTQNIIVMGERPKEE